MFLLLASLASLCAIFIAKTRVRVVALVASYAFFFATPLLTSLGVVGVLTGMAENPTASSLLFGISFYTLFLSLHLHKNALAIRQTPVRFLLQAINPVYFFTGPVPTFQWDGAVLRKAWRRARVVHNDLLYGVVFSVVLAPSLKPYLALHASVNAVDILLFGIVYEFYVYLNFCGFSTIAWVALRMLGVRAPRNFRQPFGAASVVEYWRRWHVSLSGVLKELFYAKIRPVLGVFPAVVVVFLASALWHGVTLNFMVWGLFHAVMWLIAYRLRGWRRLNYVLLAFTVVMGRIIFSEIDPDALATKVRVLLMPWQWHLASDNLELPLGLRNRVNLVVCIVVLLAEIVMGRTQPTATSYQHLRGRVASAFVALYLCLFLADFTGGPVYGDR